MKLDLIQKEHIINASLIIDENGIPKDNLWSQYHVLVNGKEYPFKYLVKTAFALISSDTLVFQSNDSYRSYIEHTLGFKLRYYEGGYTFFTKEELNFYHSIANKDYRTSNAEQRDYGQKLYPIIAKAKYWAEQLLFEDYKLKTDSNWLTGHTARIAPYFWPRIYKNRDEDVFFNVEVNGLERFIGYKLDGYYKTKKALPDHKIKILDDYKNEIEWEWPQISFDSIDEYNWERLITESKQYINKYKIHLERLKKLLSRDFKIAQITWNSNGWIRPSGREGKLVNSSFEKEFGFGLEEWLFDNEKIIDGYKYGFLEPIHKFRDKYIGQLFDLILYTRDGLGKVDYLVTTLIDVEVITKDESIRVLKHYNDEGWYDQMRLDLYNLNLDENQLDRWVGADNSALFNIKFKSIQLQDIPSELVMIDSTDKMPSDRCILMDAEQLLFERFKEKIKKTFSFDDSGSFGVDLSSSSKRKSVAREIELDLKHNLIQKEFLIYLQNQYGESNVKRECTAFGASRIDITRQTETGYIFYEIKTYNNLVTSIRNSIGQLMEYCFYPNNHEAEELVLVSDISPSIEVQQYITHLKKYLSIPFSYIQFDFKNKEIITKI